MSRACRLTVIFLTLSAVAAFAVPRLTSVAPDAVAPGGTAVAQGSDLGRASVDSLYLTAGGTDIEVEISEQGDDSIKFTVPDSAAMKRYRLMVLTGGANPAYMEQPVALEIVDEATAKQRAEEGDVELEIIEAEPVEEEEEEPQRRRRRRNN